MTACACQCSCRLSDSPIIKKDTSIQTSPMFEFVGSIPHIDSDEDDDKESVRSGKSCLDNIRPMHKLVVFLVSMSKVPWNGIY